MVQEERPQSDAERVALTVLEMVQVLHQRGYELLRIVPRHGSFRNGVAVFGHSPRKHAAGP